MPIRTLFVSFAVAAATSAAAADWRTVGVDLDVDMQSATPGQATPIVAVRHSDLASEGLPPPAASAIQHDKIVCASHTAEGLDVAYYDAGGHRLPGGGTYPARQILVIRPGGLLAKVEAMVCRPGTTG